MFLGFKIAVSYLNGNTRYLTVKKGDTHLDELVKLIADKYVDSLDIQQLYENGVEGILSSLDPHTVYIPPQETDQVNEELEGNIFGIGIEFYIYRDTIHVLSILENSPAKKQHITPGDLILAIDDSIVAGKKLNDEDVIGLIKGKKNTFVALRIQKPDGQKLTLKLERQTIINNSIVAAYVVPQHQEIGYIAIKIFSENTHQEFKEALAALKKQNISKLIIDVRDNPGGYMDAVTAILDELIAGEDTLLSTRNKTDNEVVKSQETGMFEQGAVCVLINENSASASEILAGVIQDLDRGPVIGSRSYGKGLVQEQFTLPDHAAIRITIARYYLPSGRCIQKDYSHGKTEYQLEIYERNHSSVLADTTQNKRKKPTFYTRKKRIVYGNEGVMPDVEVFPKNERSDAYDSVYHYNLVELFASNYYYFHKKDFSAYTTATQFDGGFEISQEIDRALFDYLHARVGSFTTLMYRIFKPQLDTLLKAEFGKLHLSNSVRVMILNRNDEVIKEAIRQLQHPQALS